MHKYKTFRAMCHKMRLRSCYYYKWKDHGTTLLSSHPIRDYYRFEKAWCKDLNRTCQSAFFTYEVKEPIWQHGRTFYQLYYEED